MPSPGPAWRMQRWERRALPAVDCEAGGHRADGLCARAQGQRGEEDARGWGARKCSTMLGRAGGGQ